MKTWMVFFLLSLGGCASQNETYLGMEDAGNGFTFRKPMPDRRDFKPWEFYYKHWSESGNQVYYSKTSYDCNGPYY
jgi:hypothetical protein